MSTYRLDKLLAPRSVAVVGASPREGSLGRAVLHNLRQGGFSGPLHLVNPRHVAIDGLSCVARIDDLVDVPDLAVVTAPARPSSVCLSPCPTKGCDLRLDGLRQQRSRT